MEVPFVDLGANYMRVRETIDDNIAAVIDDTQFIGGEPLKTFERNFANFIDVNEGIGVASGTDAIYLGLKALGVGPGDEVITVSHTFISTVDGILNNGARPRFVDVDPETYTMNPDLIEAAITPDTAAILPVHLYGHPVDIDPILDIASDHNLSVLEDTCQAHGARYGGDRVGGFGDLSCFSFYPSKNLGAFGDAGLVATDDPDLAERVRTLREYGQVAKHEHRLIGYNSRMDTIQGAILDAKLPELDVWNDERRAAARRYNKALSDEPVVTPSESDDVDHVFHLYVVRTSDVNERNALQSHMSDWGISTGIHYPVPVHKQPSYQALNLGSITLPVTEEITNCILSLPMFPEISDEQINAVVRAVHSFYH